MYYLVNRFTETISCFSFSFLSGRNITVQSINDYNNTHNFSMKDCNKNVSDLGLGKERKIAQGSVSNRDTVDYKNQQKDENRTQNASYADSKPISEINDATNLVHNCNEASFSDVVMAERMECSAKGLSSCCDEKIRTETLGTFDSLVTDTTAETHNKSKRACGSGFKKNEYPPVVMDKISEENDKNSGITADSFKYDSNRRSGKVYQNTDVTCSNTDHSTNSTKGKETAMNQVSTNNEATDVDLQQDDQSQSSVRLSDNWIEKTGRSERNLKSTQWKDVIGHSLENDKKCSQKNVLGQFLKKDLKLYLAVKSDRTPTEVSYVTKKFASSHN
uniref:Uncharacterized protein n=1 Tax=Corethron hystrix TaxID=216773 RepID=A0A7S1G1I0_9STRA